MRLSLPLLLLPAAAGAFALDRQSGAEDFADFAGRELSERGIQEFCRDGVLPLVVNLVGGELPKTVS